ncbi:MAG: Ribose import permease protein RbsC [Fimbriimonadaceae bacterium]|nr:Ribose import permease protein RbsC [Fimbriimonadaceae bacterium]
MRSTSAWNLLGLVVTLLLLGLIFHFRLESGFLTRGNLETIARQSAIVLLTALGMTFIIVSGGIDLSVGSMVALVTVVIAWCLAREASPAVALVAGLAAGVVCGLANGSLIVGLGVGPFIVTLGTLLLFRGMAKGLANEQKIDAPLSWLNDFLAVLPPDRKWMVVPVGVWVAILAAVAMSMVLRRSPFGRAVVAVGGNEQAARYSGVQVGRVKLAVFALGGLFAGIAGLMQFSRLTVGDPTVAQGLELDAIAAVVIGGASLSGGKGTIFGTVLGALIMTVLRAGLSQMGLPNWVQEIVTGTVIVAAVALDRLRTRT